MAQTKNTLLGAVAALSEEKKDMADYEMEESPFTEALLDFAESDAWLCPLADDESFDRYLESATYHYFS